MTKSNLTKDSVQRFKHVAVLCMGQTTFLKMEDELNTFFYIALKVPGWWVGWGEVDYYPLLTQAPTPVEVELGCDNTKNQLPRLPQSGLKVPGSIDFVFSLNM